MIEHGSGSASGSRRVIRLRQCRLLGEHQVDLTNLLHECRRESRPDQLVSAYYSVVSFVANGAGALEDVEIGR